MCGDPHRLRICPALIHSVDDCTRMTWLYLMKHKDEVLNIFETFHAMVCTQYGATIKVLRSDNGGEYVNKHLKTYFNQHGLIHETSCSDTMIIIHNQNCILYSVYCFFIFTSEESIKGKKDHYNPLLSLSPLFTGFSHIWNA